MTPQGQPSKSFGFGSNLAPKEFNATQSQMTQNGGASGRVSGAFQSDKLLFERFSRDLEEVYQ